MVLTPLTHLSSTGEVAEFIDDNQFGHDESQNKCGPESISVFLHSVAPGQHNPFTREEIHSTAHDDYVNIAHQPRNPSGAGIDNETFYRMIEHHGISYRNLPRDWMIIREWLKYGYPVIIGGVKESTILDAALNGTPPYDWNDLEGRWHIIMATGLGSRSDRLKFRDTANWRSGPREYLHEQMNYTLATLMVPKWMPEPTGDRPHIGRNTWMSAGQQQQAENSWTANTVGAPAHTGIYNEWTHFYMNGLNFGPPVTKEYETVDWSSNKRILQWFAGGVHYEFDPSNGTGTFFDNHSEMIPRP